MAIIKKILQKDENYTWNEYEKMFFKNRCEIDPSREISIITLEGYEKLTDDERKGFCHYKFKPNLVIEGLDTSRIVKGMILCIGETKLGITKNGKDCHVGCPALSEKHNCFLKNQILFAKIIEQGIVKIKDRVKF